VVKYTELNKRKMSKLNTIPNTIPQIHIFILSCYANIRRSGLVDLKRCPTATCKQTNSCVKIQTFADNSVLWLIRAVVSEHAIYCSKSVNERKPDSLSARILPPNYFSNVPTVFHTSNLRLKLPLMNQLSWNVCLEKNKVSVRPDDIVSCYNRQRDGGK